MAFTAFPIFPIIDGQPEISCTDCLSFSLRVPLFRSLFAEPLHSLFGCFGQTGLLLCHPSSFYTARNTEGKREAVQGLKNTTLMKAFVMRLALGYGKDYKCLNHFQFHLKMTITIYITVLFN